MRVLLCGTFDHLHPGHRFFIEEGKKRGELTIIVARDSSVHAIKGRASIQPEHERLRAIQSACTDVTVVLGDEKNFLQPILDLRPDLLLLGYDQSLPPGVSAADIPCVVERLPAFEPHRYKSSLRRKDGM